MKTVWVLCILLAFEINPVFGQWEYEGHTIGLRYGSVPGLAVANVGNGATIVVWISGYGNDYDLFAQYVDSAGYARWGEGGLLLFDDDHTLQADAAILDDGEGGAFIIWSDWRHFPDEGIAIYGQRIDSMGNFYWDRTGRRFTAGSMSHEFSSIYDDGHNGFIAVYRSSYYDVDVGAQRVDGNGNILWDSTGITLVSAPYDQMWPKTCRAGDSTFITCWVDGREPQTYHDDIYMQKFDLEGNIHWGGTNGLPAIHHPADQGLLSDGHDIVADGYGGAVVVWVDNRHLGENSVLYANRFSPEAQSLWQPYGVKLGDENIFLAYECQAFNIGPDFMFSWRGGGTGFQVSYLDVQGNFIWDEPVVLDTIIPKRNVVLTDSSNTFYYLTAYWENGHLRSKGAKIDTLGNRLWQPLPYVGYYMLGERVILDGYGGMIVVWKDLESPAIKISRIYADGHVGGDTPTAVYSNHEDVLPNRIRLHQNYPNPFNNSTIVSYQLFEESDISLEIYDILGRKIIANTFLRQSAGLHKYNLEMNNQPSGLYFIRVSSSDGFSSNIKTILLK